MFEGEHSNEKKVKNNHIIHDDNESQDEFDIIDNPEKTADRIPSFQPQ